MKSNMERTAMRSVTIGFKLDSHIEKDEVIRIQSVLAKNGFRPANSYHGTKTTRPDDYLYEGWEREHQRTTIKFAGESYDFGRGMTTTEKKTLNELVDNLKDAINYHGEDIEITEQTETEKHKPRLRGFSCGVWIDWGKIEWEHYPADDKMTTSGWSIGFYDDDCGEREAERIFIFKVSTMKVDMNRIELKINLTTDKEASILEGDYANSMIRSITKHFRSIVQAEGIDGFYARCQSTLSAKKSEVCDVSWLMPAQSGGEEE